MKLKIAAILLATLMILTLSDCDQRPTFWQGEILYSNTCENCHMKDGTGLKAVIPPLANSDFVKADPIRVACIIRNGLQGAITVNDTSYNQPMAGIPTLTDFEITNIINYINQAWGNDFGYVKFEQVKASLDTCTHLGR